MASLKIEAHSRRRRGQGMTEYILIVALIAIASIAVVTAFGNNIRHLFGMAIDAIAGDTSVANRAKRSDQSKEKVSFKEFEKGTQVD